MNRLPRLLSRVALACAIAAPFVSVPAIYGQDAAAEPMPDEQPATTDGARLVQWGCHNGTNQQWRLTPA